MSALLAGCGPVALPLPASEAPPVVTPVPPAAWAPILVSPTPMAARCWGEALPGATLDLGITEAEWAVSPLAQEGLLVQAGRAAPMGALLAAPTGAGCLGEELAAQVLSGGQEPVADLVRLGAEALGARVNRAAEVASAPDFEAAREALCAAAGGCGEPQGSLPEALQATLTPILAALADTLTAQAALFADDPRGEAWWRANGGHLVLTGAERPNPAFPSDRAVLLADRAHLYAAAERLARTVERASWPAAPDEAAYRLPTARGAVVVAGTGADVHAEGGHLLLVDLGGDDLYLGAEDAPVSLVVDLSGDDVYAYPGAEDLDAADTLPADAAGRGDEHERVVQGSLSEAPRQGGARGGVALLFDLGAGRDRYVTLRGGQGYAQEGVGVLFDAGGDDTYVAEAGAQGAAQLGIGLLVDLGRGQDRREALFAAQGFAGPGGFGALVDDGGDDVDRCLPTPARYPAPQRPEVNASFCQGAGLGFRAEDPMLSLGGGLGLFVDGGGDDRQEVAVFGQGAGYWMGTGAMVDAGGADERRHQWYAAGAAAHFGVGVLVDLGPEGDTYGDPAAPAHMSLGAAHHFGLGVLVEAGGDDVYALPTLGAGAASCGAVGLMVDEGGDDTYLADHTIALAVATLGTCDERGAVTRAAFMDQAGTDTYPAAVVGAADGARWGLALEGDPMEQALASDAPSP